MPSRTEMRCWLLLALALAWGGVIWVLWDWLHWTPEPSTEATMHPLQTSVVRTTWGTLVGMVFGVLACTRFAWCLLRQDREP